ncbi:MAG: glycosyl hydrolase family 28-related protein [Phormidesmis sp.]
MSVFSTKATAEDIVLPNDAMVNVTQAVADGGCGLVGNGRVDNTQALRACIKKYANLEIWEKDGGPHSPLYFPNGTYLFSDSISWQAFLFLQGQSRDRTILKLANNAPGFSDSAAPKVFIGFGENQQDFYGVGFRNIMRNFTLDVGTGNPGAIGLSYYGNNQSNAENILIKTSDAQGVGWAGVAERGGSCPGLLKNITVEGFDYGLVPASGCTHENITLRQQNAAGIYCTRQRYTGYDPNQDFSWGGGVGVGGRMIAILNLVSENSAPAFNFNPDDTVTPASCGVTLINAQLKGGKPGTAAINTVGPIYARNVTTQGYQVAICDQGNQRRTGTTVKEYASEIYAALPNGDLSLNQPFKATPDTTYPHVDQARWASVVEFGANPDDQEPDTGAIQSAIDSGAEVIYFPSPKDQKNQTTYLTNDTIVIRGNVRFVLGLGNGMKSYGGMAGKSVFRIEETTGDAVVFDAIALQSFDNARDHNIFEHNSRKKLVIKSSLFGTDTRTSRIQSAYFSQIDNPGTLFVEDVVGSGHFAIKENGEMYAKQFNLNVGKTLDKPLVSNQGGLVSIMQWRPENSGPADTEEPLMRTTNGGSSEILSTWIDNQKKTSPDRAAFEVTDANLFVNARFPGWGRAYKNDPDNPFAGYVNYHIAVRDTRKSNRQELNLYDTRQLPNGTDYSVTAYVTKASSPANR